MARYFGEKDINEFKECYYLHVQKEKKDQKEIKTLDELTVIMRSLGVNPTINELKKYFKDKGGKIEFADFLDIMHQHEQVEKIPQEILSAFKAYDSSGRGVISAKDLRHILSGWGEKVSSREVDRLFREANISANGVVKYEDFVRLVTAPVPDYY